MAARNGRSEPSSRRATTRSVPCRDQDGPSGPSPCGRRVHARHLQGVDGPFAREPRGRPPRPGSVALPAVTGACSTHVPTRTSRRSGARGRVVQRGGLRRDRSGGARRDRRAGRHDRQIIINVFRRKPLEPSSRRRGPQGIMVIARVPLASGPAEREVRRGHDLPRRRSPDVQPARARRSTWGRPSRACRTRWASGRRGRSRRSRPRDGRRPDGAAVDPRSAVDTVIPGARNVEQAVANAAVGDLPSLSDELHAALARDLQSRHSRARPRSLVAVGPPRDRVGSWALAPVAQGIEHRSPKAGVARSNRARRTTPLRVFDFTAIGENNRTNGARRLPPCAARTVAHSRRVGAAWEPGSRRSPSLR